MESDLVGLRAELHKKRAEASKYGAGQRGLLKKQGDKSSKTTSFNILNAGVAIRDAKDKQQEKEETPSEETARAILEKKALLYEKLHGGIETLEDDTLNEKYLVNFQRKIIDDVAERKKLRDKEKELEAEQREREELEPENYKASEKENEWVEYTDVLGRTRHCMRKDLTTMVEQDKDLLGEEQDEDEKEAELISGEKHREKLHEKWERESEINAFKKDLHYQDITYNEARMHGTGFMKFSQDEKERKTQMDMLKEMHEEAAKSEQANKIVRSKKQKLLEARLEKVRQRKRLKLGLPMKDDDKLKTPPVSDDEEDIIGPPLPPQQDALLENPNNETKSKKPREWDLGKTGVGGGPGPISQEAWVDRQRKERVEEFAPPTLYSSGKWNKTHNHPSSSHRESNVSEESHENWEDNRHENGEDNRPEVKNNQFAPPSTYEYYGPSNFSSRHKNKKPSYKVMENSIDKGLSHLRNLTKE